MHGDGVLVSRWPQRFTVLGVGIATHALLLAIVNNGDAVGRLLQHSMTILRVDSTERLVLRIYN